MLNDCDISLIIGWLKSMKCLQPDVVSNTQAVEGRITVEMFGEHTQEIVHELLQLRVRGNISLLHSEQLYSFSCVLFLITQSTRSAPIRCASETIVLLPSLVLYI